MPQMIKPGDVPLGAIVSGEIIRSAKVRWAQSKASCFAKARKRDGITFLALASSVNALIRGSRDRRNEDAERDAAERPCSRIERRSIKTFYAKRLDPNRPIQKRKFMLTLRRTSRLTVLGWLHSTLCHRLTGLTDWIVQAASFWKTFLYEWQSRKLSIRFAGKVINKVVPESATPLRCSDWSKLFRLDDRQFPTASDIADILNERLQC